MRDPQFPEHYYNTDYLGSSVYRNQHHAPISLYRFAGEHEMGTTIGAKKDSEITPAAAPPSVVIAKTVGPAFTPGCRASSWQSIHSSRQFGKLGDNDAVPSGTVD